MAFIETVDFVICLLEAVLLRVKVFSHEIEKPEQSFAPVVNLVVKLFPEHAG
jgi:hypothetical protein